MTPDFFAIASTSSPLGQTPRFSPLILADRLISLAQEADRAGLHDSASRLLGLVYAVLDDENG
ncbi:MAG: hypothetical protein RQ966_03735 [Acetobacteraceae bacterium]|nr:hypothetical protein [Acetobacteraceae bacterium]